MFFRNWERLPSPQRAQGLAAVGYRIKAIAMSESWFEHRAVSENAEGWSDIGIAQATP
jgi:hypothetical protein